MNHGVPGAYRESELIEAISRILADPEHDENPLRTYLAQLFEASTQQRERMERLIRISDGFQDVDRERTQSLAEEYDQHLHRLEKLIRISDRYQESLRELNASLQDAAMKDPLTGLGNRRYLAERLRAEVERSERGARPLSVALLDVDHFKSVNDALGHDAGDELLCCIATTIDESLREYDICGRWGGEEFLMVFPETPMEQAAEVCERVRDAIRSISFRSGDGVSRITASIGLASLMEGEGYSATINRADALLMSAKQAGRDRLITAC